MPEYQLAVNTVSKGHDLSLDSMIITNRHQRDHPLWKSPEFEVFAGAPHPQIPQIRALSLQG
jgi:hypothetical protein